MLKRRTLVCVVLLVTLTLCGSFRIGDLDFGASKFFEEGVGNQHASEKFAQRGEKGDLGYKTIEEEVKGAKGFHDKENHKRKHAELEGDRKGFFHKDGYFAEKHKGQKGDKGIHYVDHGHFKKGHKTKGKHNVHRIDEYKKETEFYDEDHDAGHKEKHGGYEIKKEVRDGGYHKKGHKNRTFLEDLFGKLDEFTKGSHLSKDSGYKKQAGEGVYFKEGSEFEKEGERDAHKKFGYSEAI